MSLRPPESTCFLLCQVTQPGNMDVHSKRVVKMNKWRCEMKNNKVPIPQKVMEGLEAVRLSGQTNMFDVPMVESLALAMGFSETAMWIKENKNLYVQGAFYGFEPT